MNLEALRQINEENSSKALADARHQESLILQTNTQEVVVKSFSLLIDFLSSHISRTEIINQLQSIGTPDVAYVVDAVNSLHDTLKARENVDITPVTQLLGNVLQELQAIPKELPEAPEQDIDYTERFKALEKTVKAVESAIKGQDLSVEVKAPIVNVPAPKVTVDAPDLKPIADGLKKVESGVVDAVKALPKSITIPDNTKKFDELSTLLEKTNKLLFKIWDKPVSSGASGGAGTSFQMADGSPARVTLSNNAMPTVDTPLAVRIDNTSTANTTYVGKAIVGSTTASAVWQVSKLDTTTGMIKTWADGDALFNNIWDNRTIITYS